ncbi:LysR family transcriptional regulator (chromosome initiation inhibitor) [Aeromonas sp. BIGb0405]|jgi:LysR family transcriptional regulator, chromosome initiation inhibitor|uniref:LysR family transcriptional regulator ArgP n=1 Tax=Aeromonas TaxID=642 RepID=UPI001CCE61F1|nr:MULTISPECIES: LysR family transcriptional regulator ArgP [Aeromonas]MCS3456716.1 LysR family transcriptional regulator (chromosome initiation inhibitor) [Aeromonas sp. BIGb0405]MCS3461063.1 LysR family transcriptional regulator (chromosome initiation inhibitor) [Aeromonas sp. BIGb0445]UBO73665.1 LysR family transcriptional regulator ArgP [Aeromonas rivuli]
MKALDYKLLLALDAVMQEQNFDRAAQRLHLTQSAISQRIKQLEQQFAEPLIIRSQPLQATPLGQKLLAHYRQVRQLEQELSSELTPASPQAPIRISIAVNADSLATWFLPALAPLLEQFPIELNLLVDDESRTLDKVREGQAFGAVSLHPQPLPGCSVDALGQMCYVLTASPAFMARHFPEGLTPQALAKAPGVAFDPRDDMHISFLRREFGLEPGGYPCHIVHSSEAFVAMAEQGLAYCLIPELQIRAQLQSGRLLDLCPDRHLIETLYWHRWLLERGLHKQISQRLISQGQAALN